MHMNPNVAILDVCLKLLFWVSVWELGALLTSTPSVTSRKKYAHNGFKFVKKNFREEQVKKYYIETFYDNKIIDDKNIWEAVLMLKEEGLELGYVKWWIQSIRK